MLKKVIGLFIIIAMLLYLPQSVSAGSGWYFQMKAIVLSYYRIVQQYNILAPIKLFPLGEFIAISNDEELHYIKIEVDLYYSGINIIQMNWLKDEMRDAVQTLLSKCSLQKAKKDYIDHSLHKAIEKKINSILDSVSSGSLRIMDVIIPVFLSN